MKANHRFGRCRSCAKKNLPARSACSKSAGDWQDAKAPSCSKVRKIVENGKIIATWAVVPGSGTRDLCGLRGEGGFEGDFGKGSDAWLDYWFE